jgi:hypothetical protein
VRNTTGVTSGAEILQPFQEHMNSQFTRNFVWGEGRVAQSSVLLRINFGIIACPFVVFLCPLYCLWYLKTFSSHYMYSDKLNAIQHMLCRY